MATFNDGEQRSSIRTKINASITKTDAMDQGVATTDDVEFAGLTVDTDTLYVDSANDRVGIGTSSPGAVVESFLLSGGSGGQAIPVDTPNLVLRRGSSTRGTSIFFHNSQAGRAGFGSLATTANGHDLRSYTGDGSEAMRIDSSGNLLVGKSVGNNGATAGLEFAASFPLLYVTRDDGPTGLFRRNTSDGDAVLFRKDSSIVGSISVTTSSTSYNTSSDERLKENIADADDASAVIDGIQVRQFDWKADGEHQRYGMIAQELDTVAPEAVTKGETEDDMWAVDYSKLVPMLVKEIQDLRKRVAELEGAD